MYTKSELDFMQNIEVSQLLLAGESDAATDLLRTFTLERLEASKRSCQFLMTKQLQLTVAQTVCLSSKIIIINELIKTGQHEL